jgi:hypothetical protein
MCMFCRLLFVFFLLFLVAIVLSVLWFTDSDYPFGIIKPFLKSSLRKLYGRQWNLEKPSQKICHICSVCRSHHSVLLLTSWHITGFKNSSNTIHGQYSGNRGSIRNFRVLVYCKHVFNENFPETHFRNVKKIINTLQLLTEELSLLKHINSVNTLSLNFLYNTWFADTKYNISEVQWSSTIIKCFLFW